MHRVAVGVLIRGDEVLLCHRHPDREWYANVWDLPGGHIEDDEEPIAGLARELHEELGVTIELPPDTPPDWHLQPQDDLDLKVWKITSWTGEITNAAPDEHDELAWFDPDRIASLEPADVADPDIITLCREATRSR